MHFLGLAKCKDTLLPSVDLFVCLFLLFQAWLTEIHEYAQSDVVIMLLGNKVT